MQNVFQKFAPEGKIFLVSRKNGHEKEKKKKYFESSPVESSNAKYVFFANLQGGQQMTEQRVSAQLTGYK